MSDGSLWLVVSWTACRHRYDFTDKLFALIEDLLQYSRSDRPEVNQVTLLCARMPVRAAVDNLKGLIAETGATVMFGELPELRANLLTKPLSNSTLQNRL